MLFQTHVHGDQPPFEVHCTFARKDAVGELRVVIHAHFQMARIMIGFEPNGLENPVCDDGEITISPSNVCVELPGFVDAGGQVACVLRAQCAESYTPPAIVQVRCKMRGTSFGGLTVRPEPPGAFAVERLVRDVLVSRSVWPFLP
jgi:hypothetical protein